MRISRSAACLAVAIAVACLSGLSGCTKADGASQTSLTVTGSTTVLPIAEVAAEDFQTANPGKRVLVAGVGSSAGIESVANGTSDIGTSSRDLKPEELTLGLVDTKIALDAIAVIVNPSNPVTGLTKAQVSDIFQGKIKNWKEVGGPDLEIGLVNRDEASGTREAFSKFVLGNADFDPTAAVLPGTGQVRSVVAQAPGAVGYISLGFVDSDGQGAGHRRHPGQREDRRRRDVPAVAHPALLHEGRADGPGQGLHRLRTLRRGPEHHRARRRLPSDHGRGAV